MTDNHGRATSLHWVAAAGCLLVALVLLIALAPPGSAGARKVVTLGNNPALPRAACPGSPCEAVGSVTGFQSKAGSVDRPFQAPFDGRIVAYSLSLSKPKSSQQNFFNDFYDSPPEARLSILRQVPNTRPPKYKLLRHSPISVLSPYLGSTVMFALDDPLVIKKGNVAALTIPTWAPSFGVGLPDDTGWRASRKKGKCTRTADIKESHPQQKIGSEHQFGCFYKTARLLYTATLVKG